MGKNQGIQAVSLSSYRELIKRKELNALRSQEIIALKERIKHLKEAGQELWKKASPFVFYYVINEEGEEVPIYAVEKSDEITADRPNTAGEIVSLIEALGNWQKIEI